MGGLNSCRTVYISDRITGLKTIGIPGLIRKVLNNSQQENVFILPSCFKDIDQLMFTLYLQQNK